jgi:hypothetical protein
LPEQAGEPAVRAGSIRQKDARRAATAAEKAGLRDYRIEIAADGTIAIVVGTPKAEGDSDSRR